MNEELFKRIDEKEVWTFHDCVGLASEFGMKTRAVIGYVFMRGKRYLESHESDQLSTSKSDTSKSDTSKSDDNNR